MTLEDLIDCIQGDLHERQDYEVYVVHTEEDLEDLTDDDGFEKFRVLEIDVEDDSKEITLVTDQKINPATDQPSEGSDGDVETLTVKELASQLDALRGEYSDYAIFSGSAMFELDEEHNVRLDTPLRAIGWNDEDRHVVLFQEWLEEE